MKSVLRRWLVAGGIFCASWLGAPLPTRACMGCWQSMERRVLYCPLIAVGEVQKVVPHAPPPPAVRTDEDLLAFDAWYEQFGDGPLTVATVNILNVLKGTRPTTPVQVLSVNRDSHGGAHQHSFLPGERLLFLFQEAPALAKPGQPLNADIYALSMTDEVENQVLRARALPEKYLRKLSAEQPAVYASALQLTADMKKSCVAWPASKDDSAVFSNDVATCTARDRLVEKLSAYPAEVIFAARAMGWFPDQEPSWAGHAVWAEACHHYELHHKQETHAVIEKWLRNALQQAGVEQPWMNDYLKAGLWEETLFFPVGLKSSFDKPPDKETLTTHLLLCQQDYFRNDLLMRLLWPPGNRRAVNLQRLRHSTFSAYALLRFVEKLDAAHLDILLEALLDADYEVRERLLGRVNSEAPALWPQLIQLGSAQSWNKFWDCMDCASAFQEICIQEALARLAAEEQRQPVEDERIQLLKRSKHSHLEEHKPNLIECAASEAYKKKSAVYHFLRYALEARAEQLGLKPVVSDDAWTAEQFRAWFRQHPAKNKN